MVDDSRIPKVESYVEKREHIPGESAAASGVTLSLAMAADLLVLTVENVRLLARVTDHIRATNPETAAEMEDDIRKMQGRINSMIDNMQRTVDG